MTLFSCVYFLPFCRSSHSLYSLIFVLFHLSFFSDSAWIQVYANPTSKVIILQYVGQEGGGRGWGNWREKTQLALGSPQKGLPVIQLNNLTGCMPNLNCGWFCSCCCCCVLLLLLLLLFTFLLLLLLFILFWREEP